MSTPRHVRKQLIIPAEIDQRLTAIALDTGTTASEVVRKAITLYITPVIYLALDRYSGRGPVGETGEAAEVIAGLLAGSEGWAGTVRTGQESLGWRNGGAAL